MGLKRSCSLLIVIAGMERFAYKGVGSNLITYLTQEVKLSNSGAAKLVSSWSGFTSMLPLLIAPLADAYWNPFSTALASSFFYILGLFALTSTALVSTWFPNNSSSSHFLFWSLCVVSIGAAGFNPSLQAFGTGQLENEEEEEEEVARIKDDERCSGHDKKSQLFQWWYFGSCSGSLMGITFMSYLQDTFGWVVGFAIPTAAMVSSTVLFCCGNRIYTHKQDHIDLVPRSLFRDVVKLIRATIGKLVCADIDSLSDDEKTNLREFEMQERPLCGCGDEVESKKTTSKHKPGNLDNTKVILRILPIWTALLMFAVIFQQPATFFTKQGMVMKHNIGHNFIIPPATLQSTITLSIILLMPLYGKMLIPFTRLFTRDHRGITVMQRMGIGMFLSIVAMVTAAQVEMKRLEMAKANASPPSIFWLLPQYILLGMSDVFTVVGMQEFFYREVPLRMRTMGFALLRSVFGVGSFVSAVMISIIEVLTRDEGSWFSDDMDEARLDKYYWVLAAGSALSLAFYIMLCKLYYSCRNDVQDGINC